MNPQFSILVCHRNILVSHSGLGQAIYSLEFIGSQTYFPPVGRKALLKKACHFYVWSVFEQQLYNLSDFFCSSDSAFSYFKGSKFKVR